MYEEILHNVNTLNREVEEAIEIIQSYRNTHTIWKNYLNTEEGRLEYEDNNYEYSIGDIEHHEKCIKGYDKVLKVLKRQLKI